MPGGIRKDVVFLLRYIPHDHREAPRLAWQSSSKAAKALGCFVSYTSSQR
ncbi:hypothetical protein [Nitrosomonas sp.]|nr:hypothetical protein [Nitrosomonas sp.]